MNSPNNSELPDALGFAQAKLQEIYLKPGDLWRGQASHGQDVVLKTLLGSCVAFTLWHPASKRGAMCHYLLARGVERANQSQGYYLAGVIDFFKETVQHWAIEPSEVEVKMFGGGNMFQHVSYEVNGVDVARMNVEQGEKQIQQAGFSLLCRDVGGTRYRTLRFDLATGDVWVRYGPSPGNQAA